MLLLYPLFLLVLVFIAKKKAYLPDIFWRLNLFPFPLYSCRCDSKTKLGPTSSPYMMHPGERYKL